jgi:hypothetical protein
MYTEGDGDLLGGYAGKRHNRICTRTAAKIVEPRGMNIEVSDDEIIAHLVDGRTLSVPLVCSIWFV